MGTFHRRNVFYTVQTVYSVHLCACVNRMDGQVYFNGICLMLKYIFLNYS